MTAYVIRRVLLMIPTLFGIMLVSFVVVQFAPGGPVERVIAQLSGSDTGATSRISGSPGGDFGQRDKMILAMSSAKIDSPRGPLSFNRGHNPIQNIYLREVRNGRNEMISVAHANLDDPARGCRIT